MTDKKLFKNGFKNTLTWWGQYNFCAIRKSVLELSGDEICVIFRNFCKLPKGLAIHGSALTTKCSQISD